LCQQVEVGIADERLAVRGGPLDSPAIEVDASACSELISSASNRSPCFSSLDPIALEMG
jgi:hypothetical protein